MPQGPISLRRVLDFTDDWAGRPEKGKPMSYRTITTIAAASILCVACFATEAMAYRGGGARVGGYHGGAYVRRGVGAAVGAAAVGAAVAAPYYNGGYYNSAACGYYPNPPCN